MSEFEYIVYDCPNRDCAMVFDTSRDRRRHVHNQHGPLPDVCSHCHEPFLATESLQRHIAALGPDNHGSPRGYRRLRKVRKPKSSTMPYSSDVYTVNSGNINSFISEYAQPDESYLNSCGEATNLLVKFLQRNVPRDFRPRRVIKGGSLCKGTALKGKSDLDIVFMLSQYTDVRTMHDNMENLLEKLERCLKKHPKVVVRGRTNRCVQIDIKLPGPGTLSADVLPAVDVLEIESRREDIYAKMEGCDKDIKGFYSPCLAPLQKTLFAKLHVRVKTKLKSLVRLVKYWKHEKLKKTNRYVKWPTSYVVELVVLNAWRKAGQPEDFDMTRLLHAVLKSLVNHKDFRVIFEGQMFYDRSLVDYVCRYRPHIIDPCNPYNNVYTRGGYAWDETATAAEEWLSKPLFLGI